MRGSTPFLLRLVLSAVLTVAALTAHADTRLIGSGASFPFPIYSAWFKDFSKNTPGATVDYQAKGSGAGIQDFIKRTVDFAASDAAMTDEEIAQVEGGVVLLPMTAGEIVLAYNIPGVGSGLKLPRDVYPDIFLGKITKWNDPRIAAANPGVKLPDLPITVVRRSDSSGTTFVFTKHLSAISEDFKKGPGFGTSVQWPASDKIVAAPKNDGITATIKQTPGAIGYIEYGYAKLTKAHVAALQNKAGKYVEPEQSLGRGGARLGQVRAGPAGLGRGPGRAGCLPDRDLHLDAVLQEAGPGQSGRAAQAGRLQFDQGAGDLGQHGVHPAAAPGGRKGQGGGGPDPIGISSLRATGPRRNGSGISR